MKFKKLIHFVSFFMFSFGLAQLPISESNSFMYNKYNYGFDFFNCYTEIQTTVNGKIVVWPDQKPYVEIGNISAKQYLKDSKISSALLKIIHFKNRTFLVSGVGLYEVFKNGETKKFVFKDIKVIDYLHVFKNKLWFCNLNEKKQASIYNYDGNTFTLFKTFDNVDDFRCFVLRIFNNQLLLIKANENAKTTSIFNVENNKISLIKTYPFTFQDIYYKNKDEFLFNHFLQLNQVYQYKNGKISLFYKASEDNKFHIHLGNACIIKDNFMNIMDLRDKKPKIVANIYNVPLLANSLYSKETNSYYLGTGNNFYRLFPFIKKYPRVFNNTNSQQIFSLTQAKDGKIWAGSYNGKLTFIDKDKITQSNLAFSYMNFGKRIGSKILLNTEFQKGILLFDNEKKYRKIVDSANSYTNFFSKDSTLYISDSFKGIKYAPWKEVIKGKAKWKKISKKQGVDWTAVDDFAEDQFGNIWGAKNKSGVFVYQPEKDKAISWSVDKKQTQSGGITLLVDNRKTLWYGTNNGRLYYYSGENKDYLSPKNFHQIIHPLLESGKFIYSMMQWKNYLILGASDKVLLFDLEKWYREKKVLVRYLNPQETNFTANTEQHTMLTDFRDESIWFSTSDMLYQWDVKNWLKLPTFKAIPEIVFKKDTKEFFLKENQKIDFKPRENSFEIEVNYQTKDNMPRYINAVLVKENEKPVFENPNLETKFKFQNLRSGKYSFFVKVCQQDGSITMHQYKIEIERFFWQNWWFWFLMSLFPIFFMYYYYRSRKEIETRKKEIAQLNLSTLSNQFRPHFMLNALNSLGTELDDKPHAEKVISRIGENINTMYDYSQERKFYTSFENEWKLVENTIEIQKIIFIKELEVSITDEHIIPNSYQIPMGILQVCVENALLHGIRHRKEAPYKLDINFAEDENFFVVNIIDNGVGREQSQKIYNFKRKGTGLKNIYSLIKIINHIIPNAIELTIHDRILNDEKYSGTKVTMKFKKNINYEKFKF